MICSDHVAAHVERKGFQQMHLSVDELVYMFVGWEVVATSVAHIFFKYLFDSRKANMHV